MSEDDFSKTKLFEKYITTNNNIKYNIQNT